MFFWSIRMNAATIQQNDQSVQQTDLLVIGGGINGTGIARDAAGRGLSVLLCEQDDLASATSSASSKLIHGGLRYLEQYEFRLVREALAEREVLLNIAPHIVRPLRFVLPHDHTLRPVWMIRAGLFLYDHLAKRSARLPGSRHIRLDDDSPFSRPMSERIKQGFIYSDCQVDDSRLVVLNAMDAQARGAQILTRTTCTGARIENGRWLVTLQDAAGRHSQVSAKVLVNAAGPWVDNVLKTVRDPDAQPRNHLRLIKGSHLVTRKLYEGDHAYILQNDDKRIVFITPHRDAYSMIGTTDVDFNGDARTAHISEEETDYLLSVVNRYLRQPVQREAIVSSWAGVRPLYDDAQGKAAAVTRDYVFDVSGGKDGEPAMLSIFGGKITTYRKLAEHALEKLQPFLQQGPAWTATAPLPGGRLPELDPQRYAQQLQTRYPWLDAALLARLVAAYGSMTTEIIGDADSVAGLGMHFGHGLYEAEARWLINREWAQSTQDILWRRTRLGLKFSAGQQKTLEHWLTGRTLAAAMARNAFFEAAPSR
jgi:glycerol-3-phosphate dehydrogenase